MDTAVYEKLIPALNSRSTFLLPSVKCDEYFALVSFLFTPLEAGIAAVMPYGFASAEDIAVNLPNIKLHDLRDQLESMAGKGLIHSKEEAGKVVYELLPFFPGSMELQFFRSDSDDYFAKLGLLLAAYMKALRNMSKAGTAVKIETEVPGRKIPLEHEILSRSTIIPYQEMKELIDNAEYIAASVCHCRRTGAMLGNPCAKPSNNCMVFGTSAKFTVEKGMTKRLTRQEALDILEAAEEAGLIHQYSNTPDHFANILCNCCGCHCFAFKGVKKSPAPSLQVIARYLIKINENDCTACEACIPRCQMEALKMVDGKLVRDEKRCIGCGICMWVCPTDALELEPRAASKLPLRS